MSVDFQSEALQHFPLAVENLPAGWQCVALADIAATVNPGFASGKHSADGSGIPHLRPMNVDRDGKIDLHVVKSVLSTEGIELSDGDVLFNNTNSPELVGKTALVSSREEGFAYSNHMTRIRVEEGISPQYAASQLHFFWLTGYSKHRCTSHVNQASLSSQTLAKTFPFILPPSEEQVRIVEKLEELLSDLDAGVAELKAAQKKLAQYRQSLLKAAVEGTLTTEWRNSQAAASVESGADLLVRILRERRARWEARQLAKFKEQGKTPPKDWQAKYPEPVAPDTTGLPALPQGWVWASAEQLCDFVTKGTTPPKELDLHGEKVIPFLRVTNLTDRGHLDLDDKVFVSEETHRGFLARSVVYPKDVLMNIVGPPLGQVSVVPETFAEWNVNQAIAIFRAVDGVLPDFLAFTLLAPPAQHWLKARAKTTAGQTNLTLEVCRSLPIPLPSQAEQKELISVADVAIKGVEEQARAIQIGLKQSAAQRKNLLQTAFSGQLVPQDPSDEPASVLLERIRTERAARTSQITPRRRATKTK